MPESIGVEAPGSCKESITIPSRIRLLTGRVLKGETVAMSGVETRSVSRDSLFLLAHVRVEQGIDQHRVRVRNLSDGGMMAEGSVRVQRGDRVEIELSKIGKVDGSVAWVQDNRFGIAFDYEIDSRRARPTSRTDDQNLSPPQTPSWAHRAPPPPDPSTLRKV